MVRQSEGPAWWLIRDATITHSLNLPQLLPRPRTLDGFGLSLREGYLLMGRILVTICLTFCLAGFSRAQSGQKFDEFGDVYPTDMAARLDNFAIQLQKEPDKLGFLIVYRSHRDLPGISGRHVEWMKNYLVRLRGVAENQIKAVDGGTASCLWHELWIVPPGSAPAPNASAYSRGFADPAVAQKFDEYYWDAPDNPPESFSSEYADSLTGFADALLKQPRSIAYIIGYGEYPQNRHGTMDRVDRPGTVARELARRRLALIKLGISPGRIKTVNGGYRNWRAMQLWILPRGALAPIATPNVAPKQR